MRGNGPTAAQAGRWRVRRSRLTFGVAPEASTHSQAPAVSLRVDLEPNAALRSTWWYPALSAGTLRKSPSERWALWSGVACKSHYGLASYVGGVRSIRYHVAPDRQNHSRAQLVQVAALDVAIAS